MFELRCSTLEATSRLSDPTTLMRRPASSAGQRYCLRWFRIKKLGSGSSWLGAGLSALAAAGV